MPALRRRPPVAKRHEVIVVGAGVLGLATAWSLGERGVDVLVLEARTPGHHGAGTKVSARIFRLGYPDPLYIDMARRTADLWRQLEAQSGRALLHVTGQVTFGPAAEAVAAALREAGVSCQALSASEIDKRFPGLRFSGPAFYEPDSGVLAADECLRAWHELDHITQRGNSPVQSLEESGDEVLVVLEDGMVFGADVVVDCAGHHAIELLGGVRCPTARPPTLQQVAYFTIPAAAQRPPVFIEWGEEMIYGLPVPGRPLYKLAQHQPATLWDEGDPLDQNDPDLLQTLVDAAQRLLPNVDPLPAATERCLYDNTADEDFIIDRLGRVVVGCGTSGHGFKFGPLLGQVMADLAMGRQPPIDLSRFSLLRSFLHSLPDT